MTTRGRSARLQKKQTRLSFAALPTSSPGKDAYSTAVQDRLASVRYSGARTRSSKSRDHSGGQAPPTPEPSSQIDRILLREITPVSDEELPSRQQKQPESPELDEEDDIVVPSSKRCKLSDRAQAETPTRKSNRLQHIDAPSGDESPRIGSRSRPSYGLPSSSTLRRSLSIGSAETSGDEVLELVSRPSTRRRTGKKTQESEDPFIVADSDDEVIISSPLRSRGVSSGRGQSRNSRREGMNDFLADDNEVEFLSSDDEVIEVRQPKSKSRRKKSRSVKEQDELEDDLKDLADGSDEDEVIDIGSGNDDERSARRTRGGPVRTQRDKAREHLELLKRRRAGERAIRVIDSDDNDPQFDQSDGEDMDNIGLDQSSPSGHWEGEEVSSESEEGPPAAVNDRDEDDDGFVVEDDESDTQSSNRRPQSGIPLAFTKFASSKPRELFVHVIEWLVKNKIAPAFERNDEVYHLSWGKINDQIKAQAGSRLISAAWNEEFKNAVMARPQIQIHHVSEGADELFLNCDACNRTNHPARYEFRLTGDPYYPDTLEPVNEDADDYEEEDADDEEGGDSACFDAAGHLLPSSRATFNLGRFCAANAEMGHKLTHWKFHLNQSLTSYLESQDVLSAEKIVARDKMSKKKREKLAEEIVDNMEATGVVAEMWQDLQNDLEDARFGMEDHVSKKGRSKARIGKVRVNRGKGRIEEWSEGGRMRRMVASDSEGE